MFWKLLAVAAASTGLIQLGALSVWVAVLSLALKAMLVIGLAAALFYLWCRFSKP